MCSFQMALMLLPRVLDMGGQGILHMRVMWACWGLNAR